MRLKDKVAIITSAVPGFAPKCRVTTDWILDLFFGREAVELGGERTLLSSRPGRAGRGQA
jgi:hypothetical protein